MKLARSKRKTAKGEWRLLAIALVVVSLMELGLGSVAAQTSKGTRILTIRVIVSFKLQPGATARVDQRQNRLDVLFTTLRSPLGTTPAASFPPPSTESSWSESRERRTTDASLPSPAAKNSPDKASEAVHQENIAGAPASLGASEATGQIRGSGPTNGSPMVSSLIEGSTPAGTSQYPQVQTSAGSAQGSTTPGSSQLRSFLPPEQRRDIAQRWFLLHWPVIGVVAAAVALALLFLMFVRHQRRSH